MQRLEVSGAVRLIYRSLGVKGLMKIRLVEAQLLHADYLSDRQTDRHEKANSRSSKFYESAYINQPLDAVQGNNHFYLSQK